MVTLVHATTSTSLFIRPQWLEHTPLHLNLDSLLCAPLRALHHILPEQTSRLPLGYHDILERRHLETFHRPKTLCSEAPSTQSQNTLHYQFPDMECRLYLWLTSRRLPFRSCLLSVWSPLWEPQFRAYRSLQGKRS